MHCCCNYTKGGTGIQSLISRLMYTCRCEKHNVTATLCRLVTLIRCLSVATSYSITLRLIDQISSTQTGALFLRSLRTAVLWITMGSWILIPLYIFCFITGFLAIIVYATFLVYLISKFFTVLNLSRGWDSSSAAVLLNSVDRFHWIPSTFCSSWPSFCPLLLLLQRPNQLHTTISITSW